MNSKPFHIVLAEDNAPDVFLVRTALEEADFDFQLHVFSDGEQVLRFLAQVDKQDAPCPDLLLLDLNLPKHNGDEILERLRQSTGCSGTPVVVLTSSDSPKDRKRAAELGAARYFRKPSDLDEFMKLGEVVKSVLSERAARAGV